MITGTLTWPMKEPGSTLDYALDLSCLPSGETVTTASGSVMPSGAGELAVQSLGLNSGSLVVWLTSGVPGRYYRIKIDVTTVDAFNATRNYEWLIGMTVDPELAPATPTTPPSAGFSTPVTWAAS
jgi:hypothetical protein